MLLLWVLTMFANAVICLALARWRDNPNIRLTHCTRDPRPGYTSLGH